MTTTAQQIAARLAAVKMHAQMKEALDGGIAADDPDFFKKLNAAVADALLDAGLREAVELLEEMQGRMICRGYCADDSAKALAALKGEKW